MFQVIIISGALQRRHALEPIVRLIEGCAHDAIRFTHLSPADFRIKGGKVLPPLCVERMSKAPDRIIWVGYSLGANIALEVGLMLPHTFALVLLSPVFSMPRPLCLALENIFLFIGKGRPFHLLSRRPEYYFGCHRSFTPTRFIVAGGRLDPFMLSLKAQRDLARMAGEMGSKADFIDLGLVGHKCTLLSRGTVAAIIKRVIREA